MCKPPTAINQETVKAQHIFLNIHSPKKDGEILIEGHELVLPDVMSCVWCYYDGRNKTQLIPRSYFHQWFS